MGQTTNNPISRISTSLTRDKGRFYHEKEKNKRNSPHSDTEKELDSALDLVLTAVDGRTKVNVDSDRRKQSQGNCGRNTAENILPGASSLEDINKYLNAAKKEKLEQLKKKKSTQRFSEH